MYIELAMSFTEISINYILYVSYLLFDRPNGTAAWNVLDKGANVKVNTIKVRYCTNKWFMISTFKLFFFF